MKRQLLFFMIVYLAFITGCATTEDLKRVQARLDWENQSLKEETANIRKDIEKSNKDIDKINESMADLRKRLADTGADITEIRNDIRSARGDREAVQKDVSTLKAKLNRESDEYKDIMKKLDIVASQVKAIENFLEIGKGGIHPEGAEKGGNATSKNTVTGKPDKESAYAAAYELFKEEKYEKARTEFKNYLKQFPNTDYSENAQYWIGECYYFEKKYEEAILEFDKVIKSYPNGNKAPSALLRQGFAFLNLGDKSSAKLILQQVIKDYPNTNNARIAEGKLTEIK